MITPELLKAPDYHLVLRLTDKIRQLGDPESADSCEDIARSSELAFALYLCMRYFAEHQIPVSYDDYQALESWFAHDDEPGWDTRYESAVDSDEAEVFKKLKIADE